jgi:murein DD-endopeptidase MepM/ murein hydrolase activator NlpD
MGVAPPPAPTAATLAPRTHPGTITVQPGETLYAISRRYQVPIRSLIEANGLAPPYRLAAGQALVLPPVTQHIVLPGETLYAISRRYGTDTTTLARANGIGPPYTIVSGQALAIPMPAASPQWSTSAVALGAPEPQPSAVAAVPLAPPPAPVSSAPAPRSAASGPREPPEPPVPAVPVSKPAAPPPQIASLPPPPRPEPPPERKGRSAISSGFDWPVRGRILAAFGPGENGTQNDGINIAAPLGAPVRAAEAGIVAYAGNELRGFGNLLLLKHRGGWISAYAHCQVLLVNRGDRVRRGQVIARVGETGNVGEPQLHFELRRGTRALDPTDYLPPVASAALESR